MFDIDAELEVDDMIRLASDAPKRNMYRSISNMTLHDLPILRIGVT